MLDVGWWELAVIGMVALIVVGPGELPALLRTIGRYVGMAKRQADEFRSQFEEAIRESEFDTLRKEMDTIKSDVTSTLDEAEESVRRDVKDAYQGSGDERASAAQAEMTADAADAVPAAGDPAPVADAGELDWVNGVAGEHPEPRTAAATEHAPDSPKVPERQKLADGATSNGTENVPPNSREAHR